MKRILADNSNDADLLKDDPRRRRADCQRHSTRAEGISDFQEDRDKSRIPGIRPQRSDGFFV
jgi:hypothetical protein